MHHTNNNKRKINIYVKHFNTYKSNSNHYRRCDTCKHNYSRHKVIYFFFVINTSHSNTHM